MKALSCPRHDFHLPAGQTNNLNEWVRGAQSQNEKILTLFQWTVSLFHRSGRNVGCLRQSFLYSDEGWTVKILNSWGQYRRLSSIVPTRLLFMQIPLYLLSRLAESLQIPPLIPESSFQLPEGNVCVGAIPMAFRCDRLPEVTTP